jgi:hypothetical protein
MLWYWCFNELKHTHNAIKICDFPYASCTVMCCCCLLIMCPSTIQYCKYAVTSISVLCSVLLTVNTDTMLHHTLVQQCSWFEELSTNVLHVCIQHAQANCCTTTAQALYTDSIATLLDTSSSLTAWHSTTRCTWAYMFLDRACVTLLYYAHYCTRYCSLLQHVQSSAQPSLS